MADTQTQLTYFLRDMVAGTLGVQLPLTALTFTTTSQINGATGASLNLLGATAQNGAHRER